MKKQLYLAIKNRLKNIPGADGQPLFKHFDLWNQQVEFIEQETPFLTPAVFVEFLPMKWRTLGNRVQDADLITRLHIVTEWHALTADYTPDDEEDRALEYLDIVDSVVAAMPILSTTPSVRTFSSGIWNNLNFNDELPALTAITLLIFFLPLNKLINNLIYVSVSQRSYLFVFLQSQC